MENKGDQELVTAPSLGCQICSEVFFCSALHHLVNLDALIQKVFRSFRKLHVIIYAFHDAIVIQFSTSLNSKFAKNLNIGKFDKEKSILGEIKSSLS